MPKVNGEIIKASEDDGYPLISSKEIKGGFHFVEKISDLKTLNPNIIQRGMNVFVAENSRTYTADLSVSNTAWTIQKQTLSVNGFPVSDDGSIDIKRFETLEIERLNVGTAGINRNYENGDRSHIISSNYNGEGILIGSGLGNVGIIAKNEATILKRTGKQYEIDSSIDRIRGQESTEISTNHHEIDFNYAFDKQVFVTGIKLFPNTKTTKTRVLIFNYSGQKIAETATEAEYLAGISPGFDESNAESGQLFNIVDQLVTKTCEPLSIKIISSEKFELAYGDIDNLGLESIKCGFIVSDMKVGKVENSSDTYKGDIINKPILMAKYGLGLAINTGTEIKQTIGIKRVTTRASAHHIIIDIDSEPMFESMSLKSISINLLEETSGLYGTLKITYMDETLEYFSKVTNGAKGEAVASNEQLSTLIFPDSIFIPNYADVEFIISNINGISFELDNSAGKTNVKLNGEKIRNFTLNDESLKSITDIVCDRDERGAYIKLVYDNGTESAKFDANKLLKP